MKIIFSDLDGTLLHRGETCINKNIKNSIYKILESGNMFSVASGRNYIELRNFFREFADDIFFVCNDGSLAVYKEQTIYSVPMDKSMFNDFREYTAHGKYVTYIKSENRLNIRNAMNQYQSHVMMIDSIGDINDDIYKISDIDKTVPCPLPVVYQNHAMNEYIADGADKGQAIEYIISILGIPPEYAYAFGDNFNDIGMFNICGTSYASVFAKPDIKKMADKIAYNIEQEFNKIIGG